MMALDFAGATCYQFVQMFCSLVQTGSVTGPQ